MAAIRHRWVEIGGLRLHVAEAGTPGAPMILFLHGFPEFWYAWRHQLAALGGQFHCLAPDTRGINLSDGPDDVAGYHLDHLVGDALGLLDHYRPPGVTLVGHDWGGFIAWETAIRHPERLDALVIVNCGHPAIMAALLRTPGHPQRDASAYMTAFRSDRGEELLSRDDFAGFRANILEPNAAAGHFDDHDRRVYSTAWNRPGALTAGLNYYRANRLGPNPLDAPRDEADGARPQRTPAPLALPTLVLWGDRDPYFTPDNVQRLGAVVRDPEIVRFADNDHWIVHQRPDDVARRVGAHAAAHGLGR